MITQKSTPVWQVDAFADEPFAGNPAAVCLLESFPDDLWLQRVAVEMNLSETAFVVPTADADRFHLRWFTPAAEVDLCGHATLASAHTLLEQGRVTADTSIRFESRSGELTCRQDGGRITLDFPAIPIDGEASEAVANASRGCLDVASASVYQSKFDTLVVLDDAESVRQLKPDFHAMKQIATRGIIATARADAEHLDFISRFFAPQHHIDEDPVTGSAHCCLTPYWAAQLGKSKLVGYQASPRGGTVHCELQGNRVQLAGTAVTVMSGHLYV